MTTKLPLQAALDLAAYAPLDGAKIGEAGRHVPAPSGLSACAFSSLVSAAQASRPCTGGIPTEAAVPQTAPAEHDGGHAAQVTPKGTRAPRRSRAARGQGPHRLTVRIVSASSQEQADAVMEKFVVGMARLATELLLEGAFDDEGKQPMSEPREMLPPRLP